MLLSRVLVVPIILFKLLILQLFVHLPVYEHMYLVQRATSVRTDIVQERLLV